jgi:hypothetical protein
MRILKSVQELCDYLQITANFSKSENEELPPAPLDQASCYDAYTVELQNKTNGKASQFQYFVPKRTDSGDISVVNIVDCLLTDAAFADCDVDELQRSIGYAHRWQAIKTLKLMRNNKEKLQYLLDKEFETAMQIMP